MLNNTDAKKLFIVICSALFLAIAMIVSTKMLFSPSQMQASSCESLYFSLDGQYDTACDVNTDGVVNAQDAICVPHLNAGAEACVPANLDSPLGTNLVAIADWSSELPFANAFKMARPWMLQGVSASGVVDWAHTMVMPADYLDADGWVHTLPAEHYGNRAIASTLVFHDIAGRYPGGEYTVLYDGIGTLAYGMAAQKVSGTQGRDVIRVTPQKNGIYIQLTSTDGSNPLRNIRLILPGHEEAYQEQPFNTDFLARLSNYKTIRFMDWMNTNNSAQSQWANRPLPSHATYASYPGLSVPGKGVALETMLALVNITGSDPWFNMPHLATDEYIESFAELTREQLGATQRVYVEFSNEVWNGDFTQAHYAAAQGESLWGHRNANAFARQMVWYGMRTAQMCDIWESAWGEDSGRVICVLGAQARVPQTAQLALSCDEWGESPCSTHNIDAVAIAPYIGGYMGNTDNRATLLDWGRDMTSGVDNVFAEIYQGGHNLAGAPQSGGALQDAIHYMQEYRQVAQQWDIDLVAYEGGQHLVGNNYLKNDQLITDLFVAANRDSRMQDVYAEYLAAWQESGGELFVHFLNVEKFTKSGSWGLSEFQYVANTQQAHKRLTIDTFIDSNPCWWSECEILDEIPMPVLSLPDEVSTGQDVTVPIVLDTQRHTLSSVAFTLRYDVKQFQFDAEDRDRNGVPDNVVLSAPADFVLSVSHTSDATYGQIHVVLYDAQAPFDALSDGTVVEVTLNVESASGSGVAFAAGAEQAAVCGTTLGQLLSCETVGNPLNSDGTGTEPPEVPLFQTPTVPPAPTFTPTATTQVIVVNTPTPSAPLSLIPTVSLSGATPTVIPTATPLINEAPSPTPSGNEANAVEHHYHVYLSLIARDSAIAP